MIKIRITGDSAAECEATRQLLLSLLPGATFAKPREGTNPKYAGNQKWMSYGEMELSTARTQRVTRRKTAPKPSKTSADPNTKPTSI
jgi:hypothetical protein